MRVPAGFDAFVSTVSECSVTDTGEVLVQSNAAMVNFDALKEDYARKIQPNGTPCSADGLFVDEKGRYVFVEFKSGDIKKPQVLKKAYESAIILSDINDQNIKWLRENVEFVLVYPDARTSEDPNECARERLFRLGTKQASRQICLIIANLKGLLYRDTLEMTPERFREIYLEHDS